LREDVKYLLLRTLEHCFIGFNLLHLDVHLMISIKTTPYHSTIPEDGVL
jgi:hypothetical protein